MNEIIVALDNMTSRSALELANSLAGKIWGFKVNSLLLEYGCDIISSLKKYGKVFADPKLHDIPNTVRNSVKRLVSAGADIVTCHLTGGVKMLNAAMGEAGDAKILGVTALTSLSCDEIRQMYRGWPLERFADAATSSKIHGVVCSAHEIPFWNLLNLIKAVPAIRPFGEIDDDDQTRTCEIVRADYLVVVRAISQAEDPVEAVQKIKAKFFNDSADQELIDALRIG